MVNEVKGTWMGESPPSPSPKLAYINRHSPYPLDHSLYLLSELPPEEARAKKSIKNSYVIHHVPVFKIIFS